MKSAFAFAVIALVAAGPALAQSSRSTAPAAMETGNQAVKGVTDSTHRAVESAAEAARKAQPERDRTSSNGDKILSVEGGGKENDKAKK